MSAPLARPQHETAIDEFVQADVAYQTFQESLLNGDLVAQVATTSRTADELRYQWVEAVNHLRSLLEDRNAKAASAASLLRSAVQLAPTQWRGANGKATKLAYGPFEASSKTSRSFNPETLIDQARKKGILERLLQITAPDKNGAQKPIVRQTWEVNYAETLKWLASNKHDDIVLSAYEEAEGTPAVQGAKSLAFLGEALK